MREPHTKISELLRQRGRSLGVIMWWATLATLLEWLLHTPPHLSLSELARVSMHTLSAFSALLVVCLLLSLSTLCEGLFKGRAQVSRAWRWLSVTLSATPWLSLGAWGYVLGLHLSRGDWVQAQPWVEQLAPALAGLFSIGGLIWWWLTRGPRGGARWWLTLGASVALQLIDLSLFRGLYPQAHATLYALATLLAMGALSAPRRAALEATPQRPLVSVKLGALSLATAIALLAWVTFEPTGVQRAALNARTPRAELLPARPLDLSARADWSAAADHLKTLNEQSLKAEEEQKHARSLLSSAHLPPVDHPLDVVLIIVDTLRYDAIYHELAKAKGEPNTLLSGPQDTPFINAWRSKRAHSFLNAYTQASRTKLSIPGTFLSADVTDRYKARSLHVAERFERAGYQTLALTEEYFAFPIKDGGSYLVDPFERSWHFTEDKQHHALPLWEELLEARDPERPMMAWVHLYMMHAPYFAGEKRMTSSDGSARGRYKMALQTLDAHLKGLIGSLERRGALEHTLIAITSDHGEGLGDHNTDGHGNSVYEEQVHTPFLLYDPRLSELPLSARRHEEVVGNVDLIPTLSELAGLPKSPLDEGRALTALLTRGLKSNKAQGAQEREAEGKREGEREGKREGEVSTPSLSWPYSYTLANGNASARGLVNQAREKLVVSPRRGVSLLYELAQDPRELHDSSGSAPLKAQALYVNLQTELPSLSLPRAQAKRAEARRVATKELSALIKSLPQLSREVTRRLLHLAQALRSPQLFELLTRRAQVAEGSLWLASAGLSIAPSQATQLLQHALSELNTAALTTQLRALSLTNPPPFDTSWLTTLISAKLDSAEPKSAEPKSAEPKSAEPNSTHPNNTKTPKPKAKVSVEVNAQAQLKTAQRKTSPEALELALAWLELTRDWSKASAESVALLERLERALSSLNASDARRLRSALISRLASLSERSSHPLSRRLIEELITLTQAQEGAPKAAPKAAPKVIQEEALTVRGRVAFAKLVKTLAPSLSQTMRASLRERFIAALSSDDTLTLKKAHLYALSPLAKTKTEREEVRDALMKVSEQRLILVPIIEELGRIGDAKSVRFLETQRRRARTNYARVSAKRALKKLKKGNRKRKRRRPKSRQTSPQAKRPASKPKRPAFKPKRPAPKPKRPAPKPERPASKP